MPSPYSLRRRARSAAELLTATSAAAPRLADTPWQLKYTPDDGELVDLFYVPALRCAMHYDRATGYFSAAALAVAMHGIEGLIRNGGKMRLLVGCTLHPAEVAAIEKGESLRTAVERQLTAHPLEPPDSVTKDALELLSWMIAQGILDVKLAIPCDGNRKPIVATGIFHEKAGIVTDGLGDKLAFSGSINETPAGWKLNWESFSVFTSWTATKDHVALEESNFAKIWANQAKRVLTLDVPQAVRADLLRFLPETDLPARLQDVPTSAPPATAPPTPAENAGPPPPDVRRLVWSFIRRAPTMSDGGAMVGEATCVVSPWPHQIRAFERLYAADPPKLLIADEVGLGKTIQAGMLLRQMWLAGRAKRILILTPAAVMKQWQLELREKFNLNWPVYDEGALVWYPSPALGGRSTRSVSRSEWYREPVVIASSQLMRRRDREKELLEAAEPWDLIVLDEAHHARRRGAGSSAEEGPNELLRLMRRLRERTKGLVLLTATPMQVHPIELWDLLDLLGVPAGWGSAAFLRFFEIVGKPAPSHEEFDEIATMFRASEAAFGPAPPTALIRADVTSPLRGRKILSALRDVSSIPRRALSGDDRAAAIRLMRVTTPVSKLVSRSTRDLLRRYYKAGKIDTPVADRDVRDEFIEMTPAERAVYDAVEDYISSTYNNAADNAKNAVGFVMTVYRRRLASSFRALRCTLEDRVLGLTEPHSQASSAPRALDDVSDDESQGDVMDATDAAAMKKTALDAEEIGDLNNLLRRTASLAVDTKATVLVRVLEQLRSDKYGQVMVFTQFTDTMDFLRGFLSAATGAALLCFSGRGGEARNSSGQWQVISRDEVKRRFKAGQAEILLCTEAAAEGLNFQFCGAIVNYDMPWNPMKVEQRIGRIDRLGQRHPIIRIVNLHYRGTVETDVYVALRQRIHLFQSVVGRLQPILAQLPRTIASTVLRSPRANEAARAQVASDVISQVDEIQSQGSGLDLDAIADADLELASRVKSPLDLDHLDRVIQRKDLVPPGVIVRALGSREYGYLSPGMEGEIRVTTNADYFEEHAESVELWSPGSSAFPPNDEIATDEGDVAGGSLSQLLADR